MPSDSARRRKGPYHQLYLTQVQHAIAACRTVSPLQHPGEKGRIREILLRTLFRPLLPADLGVGTGFIVGAAGAVSSQQDIVLYDRSILPPALFDSELGFFPIESVLETIEVKSVLTRQELLSTQQSAKTLDSFMLHDKGGKMVTAGPRPSTAIFALDTDLAEAGKTESARYDEVRGTGRPYISAICVVGRGYWWFNDGEFQAWPERYEFSEVMGFLTGILNALPHQYELRRSARPPMGAYLSDFGADFTYVLLGISRLGEELDALLKSGGVTRDSLDVLDERFRALSLELDEVFAEYPSAKLREGHQKARALADGVGNKILAAKRSVVEPKRGQEEPA